MQLIRFTSITKIAVTFVGLIFAYLVINAVFIRDEISVYQHPHYISLLYIGYFLLLSKYDFCNSMAIARYRKLSRMIISQLLDLLLFSVSFFALLFIAVFVFGQMCNDDFSLSKFGPYLVFFFLNLIVLNSFWIAFSLVFNAFVSKVIMLVIVSVSYGINYYWGNYCYTYNFLLYPMRVIKSSAELSVIFIIYGIVLVSCALLLFVRRKEL